MPVPPLAPSTRVAQQVQTAVWKSVKQEFHLTSDAVPDELFHYTSAAGFRGILEQKLIWATDSLELNDPKEGQFADEVFHRLLVDSQLPTEVKALTDKVLEMRQSPGADLFRSARIFVSAFTQNPNDLSQWRVYADDGRGYVLGILSKQLHLPKTVAWVPVVYTEEKQRAILQAILLQVLDHAATLGRQEKLDEAETLRAATWACDELLRTLKPCFKHSAYTDEAEWRLIQLVSLFRPATVKTRLSAHRMVSYLPIGLAAEHGGNIPMSRVLMGPANTSEVETVWDFLRECSAFDEADLQAGFNVTRSDVPYRSAK